MLPPHDTDHGDTSEPQPSHEPRAMAQPPPPPTQTETEFVDFHAVDWVHGDVPPDPDEAGEGGGGGGIALYNIKILGRTAEGGSVAIDATGFTPYFYLLVPDDPGRVLPAREMRARAVEQHLRDALAPRVRDALVEVKLFHKKRFHGFEGGRQRPFLRVSFRNLAALRYVVRMFDRPQYVRGVCRGRQHRLRFEAHESNIDPLLRFIHIRDLQPSGWVRVPRARLSRAEALPTTGRGRLKGSVHWMHVAPLPERTEPAPLAVAAFDIECTSLTGGFPVANPYARLANDAFDLYAALKREDAEAGVDAPKQRARRLCDAVASAFTGAPATGMHRVAYHRARADAPEATVANKARRAAMDLVDYLSGSRPVPREGPYDRRDDRARVVARVEATLRGLSRGGFLPPLLGDPVIQVGTTFHLYGSDRVHRRHIAALGTCDALAGVEVQTCETEAGVIAAWCALIRAADPDVVTGWNIFGFDFQYLRDRAVELGCEEDLLALGRVPREHHGAAYGGYVERAVSSSAMGDNLIRFLDMPGRVVMDLMKLVQRDHKLDSYKLDNVARHFTGETKRAVSPQDIFRLQAGGAADRAVVADYCVQDCELCNRLVVKLDILANSVGMSNVCLVPLSFICLRGQGVKIFSLVAKQVRGDGFVMPVNKPYGGGAPAAAEDDASYEGATVLVPEPGIYTERPVVVMDYASLYPSSMISENISHDTLVLDPRYDNLPGYRYADVEYNVYQGTGDDKAVVGTQVCRYAEEVGGGKGVLPRILQALLAQRKLARRRMREQRVRLRDGTVHLGFPGPAGGPAVVDAAGEVVVAAGEVTACEDAHDDFAKAVFDGLQLAYKVTANSLYGQLGARTSPIFMKQLAASTTAVGRAHILRAQEFVEARGGRVVYGDTDSVFVVFPPEQTGGETGRAAIVPAIRRGKELAAEFSATLKRPQCLEYEKVFWPFIIFSKKRYVAHKYEDDDTSCSTSSMGIVLKRRDQPVGLMKEVYGGAIDLILRHQDVARAYRHVEGCLEKIAQAGYPLDWFVITKTLSAVYKQRSRIAHAVLADRINAREPGSVNVGDRIPYVFVVPEDEAEDPAPEAKAEAVAPEPEAKAEAVAPEPEAKAKAVAPEPEAGSEAVPPAPDEARPLAGTVKRLARKMIAAPRPVPRVAKPRPVKRRKLLQGERIETPEYARAQGREVDYAFYIESQIMKPVTQLFSLAVEELPCHRGLDPRHCTAGFDPDDPKYAQKVERTKAALIKAHLFQRYLGR